MSQVSYKILCALVLALVFSIPIASAEEISNVNFTSPDISGNVIIPNQNVKATFSFIVNETVSELLLSTSEFMTPSGGLEQLFPAKDCPNNVCSIPVTLNIPSDAPQHDVHFTVTTPDSTGAYVSNVYTYRFNIDTTAPVLVSIGTPTCDPVKQGQCSLKTGASTITARFTETQSGMKKEQTVLRSDSGDIIANSCSQNECNFTVNIPSGANGDYNYTVVQAADRSGNMMAATSTTQTFTVDTTPPSIILVRTDPDSNVITSSFVLRAEISDASPISVVADVSRFYDNGSQVLLAMTCNKQDATYVCTLNVNPVVGAYTSNVNITATDSAGNVASIVQPFRVAKQATTAGNFWDVSGELSNSNLDAGSANLFTTKLYATLSLTGSNAQIISVDADDCSFTRNGANGAIEQVSILPTQKPQVLGANTANPVLVITIPPQQGNLDNMTGTVLLTCQVSITSISGDTYYGTPEEQNVTMPVKITDSPLLSTTYDDYLKSQQDDYLSSRQSLLKFKSTYSSLAAICTPALAMKSAEAGTNGAQLLVSMVPIVGQTASTPIKQVSDNIQRTGDSYLKTIMPICNALTCNDGGFFGSQQFLGKVASFGGAINPKINNLFDTVTGVSSGGEANFIRPEKSILVAVATGCVPAIIQQEENYQMIKCDYVSCLSKGGAGVPASACGEQKSYQECKFWTGAAFYLTPGAMLEYIYQNTLVALSSPFAALGYVSGAICDPIPLNTANAFCKIPKTFQAISGVQGMVTQLSSITSQIGSTTTTQADLLCNPDNIYSSQTADLPRTQSLCHGGFCCYDGYCGIGNDLYKIAPKNAANIDSSASSASGQTLVKVDSNSVPSADAKIIHSDQASFGIQGLNLNGPEFTDYYSKQQAVTTLQSDVSNLQNSYAQENSNEIKLQELSQIIQSTNCNVLSVFACSVAVGDAAQNAGIVIPPDVQDALSTSANQDGFNALSAAVGAVQQDISASQGKQTTIISNLGAKEDNLKSAKDAEAAALTAAHAQIAKEHPELQSAYSLTGLYTGYQVASLFSKATGIGDLGLDNDIRNALQKSLGFSDIEQAVTDAVCKSNIEDSPGFIGLTSNDQLGGYIVGTVIDTHASTDSIDPMYRDQVVANPPSEDNTAPSGQYNYALSVSLSLPSDNTKVDVFLRGASGDSDVLRSADAQQSTTAQWTDVNAVRFSSDQLYTQACMRFNKNIENVFPTTQYKGQQELCVQLKQVQG